MWQEKASAEAGDFCRHYASLNDADRGAIRATIDSDRAARLVGFARTMPLRRRTLPEIENALLAAGLAIDSCCIDPRDVFAATDELRKDLETWGETPHVFVERVAPLVSERGAALLRTRCGRRLHAIRFADNAQSAIPQHNVFESLLKRPRLALLLVQAIEAALQLRIDRSQLRFLLQSIWLERATTELIRVATSDERIVFVARIDKYCGEVVVRLDCKPTTGLLKKLSDRGHCQQEQRRFRIVVEGFTTSFAPLLFANVDRLTVFKRSTHEILDWRHSRPHPKA